MMSSRERTRLDDDIDALLLSHQMHSKERIKKERRGWSVWIHPYTWEWQRGVIHHGFLLALKSRVLVASKERRRKAKTLGLSLALQKSYLFRCFFALRAARQPFRHQSSQHFLPSHLFIFLRVRFLSRPPRKSSKDFAFYSFWSRAAVWLHSLQSKKFSSLSLFSLSLSLSLSIIYTYIYEKKLKKSSSKPVVVV